MVRHGWKGFPSGSGRRQFVRLVESVAIGQGRRALQGTARYGRQRPLAIAHVHRPCWRSPCGRVCPVRFQPLTVEVSDSPPWCQELANERRRCPLRCSSGSIRQGRQQPEGSYFQVSSPAEDGTAEYRVPVSPGPGCRLRGHACPSLSTVCGCGRFQFLHLTDSQRVNTSRRAGSEPPAGAGFSIQAPR